MRFLTTSLVARLFFGGSRTAANKRLRRLFDAGLLRTWVRDLAQDNVYALTPTGRDTLAESDPAVDAALPCPRRLDGQLDHLLAVNAVRVEFATSIGAEIVWWQSDWELRRFARRQLVPDARFVLRWPESGEHLFALEVEAHTRAPRRFLGKILGYAALRSRVFGGSGDEAILVVGLRPAVLERYRTVAASLSHAGGIWFTTLEELQRFGAGGTIWRRATDESRGDLTNLPYGKASATPESDGATRLCPGNAAHTWQLELPMKANS